MWLVRHCPICHQPFTNYPEMRETINGYWCKECQDKFDSIDWDEIREQNLGM